MLGLKLTSKRSEWPSFSLFIAAFSIQRSTRPLMSEGWIIVNSLAPGRPGCHFETAIFNLFYWLVSSNRLRMMPWDECQGTSPVKSQYWFRLMAWCRQATSHYLSQCWPGSMSPYGVTRPQWVIKDVGESNQRSETSIRSNTNYVVLYTTILMAWQLLITG